MGRTRTSQSWQAKMRKAVRVLGITRMLFSSQLRINMVSGTAVAVVNSVVLAVAYPLYLHFLGYEQYGVWLVLSTVISFAQLGNLGIGHAVTKLVAEEYGRNDTDAVEQYIFCAIAILVVSGVVVLVLVLALKQPIIALFRLSEANAHTVSWLLPYTACLTVYIFIVQALNAVLSGVGRIDLANYVQTCGRVVGVVVAGVLLSRGRGISSLLLGSALSYVFIHLATWVLIRRITQVRLLQVRNLSLPRVRRLLGFGTTVLGMSLVNMLLTPFNRLVLARYAGVASVPIYEIAYFGSMQVRGLIEAGFRALMPEVSRIAADMSDLVKERIRRLHRMSTGAIVLVGLPVYGSLIVFLDGLLHLWLQDRMAAGLTSTFRVMLIGSFVSLVGVPPYYTLLGLGRADQCLSGQILMVGVNVVIVGAIVMMGLKLSVLHLAIAALPAFGVNTAYLMVQNRKALDGICAGCVRRPAY
jgi:O-antigen/teichoic acid export membrane protein